MRLSLWTPVERRALLNAVLRIRATAATDALTSPLRRASTPSISPLLGGRSPRALTLSMWERVRAREGISMNVLCVRQEREVGEWDIHTGLILMRHGKAISTEWHVQNFI